MRRIFLIVSAFLLTVPVIFATDEPGKYETFVGYDFVRFQPNNTGFIPEFNANGGSAQFVYNFYKGLGVVFDAGAVTKGTLNGFSIDTTVANFLVGPRYKFHNHSRFTPFVEVMFGGAYSTTSTQISFTGTPTNPIVVPPAFAPIVTPHGVATDTVPVTARLVASTTRFAMMAGGGLDIKINKHVSFRPIGADYYLSRLPDLLTGDVSNQHNFRYSTGFTFTFGAE